jgi:hypothetical protein
VRARTQARTYIAARTYARTRCDAAAVPPRGSGEGLFTERACVLVQEACLDRVLLRKLFVCLDDAVGAQGQRHRGRGDGAAAVRVGPPGRVGVERRQPHGAPRLRRSMEPAPAPYPQTLPSQLPPPSPSPTGPPAHLPRPRATPPAASRGHDSEPTAPRAGPADRTVSPADGAPFELYATGPAWSWCSGPSELGRARAIHSAQEHRIRAAFESECVVDSRAMGCPTIFLADGAPSCSLQGRPGHGVLGSTPTAPQLLAPAQDNAACECGLCRVRISTVNSTRAGKATGQKKAFGLDMKEGLRRRTFGAGEG